MYYRQTRKKQLLSGDWLVDIDPNDIGKDRHYWERPTQTAVKTHVPSVIQESFPDYNGVAWYWCDFHCALKPSESDKVFVKFGAVDYKAHVWFNGEYLGEYEGGESAFEFDVTDLVKLGRQNRVAVRVINTCDRTIDGLNITNTPNRNKLMKLRSGHTINYGGIIGQAELFIREAIAITDAFVTSDIHTGEVKVQLDVCNTTGHEETVQLLINIIDENGTGRLVAGVYNDVPIAAGQKKLEYSVRIPQPILWELDNPYLYRVNCELHTPYRTSFFGVRHGLREFKVKDGFFYLNDKRIFLKCAHSGNAQPVGLGYPAIKDFTRRDFINAKASGFNMVRVCAFLFRPEQLDFCDELGLLIMDECYAAWMIAVELNQDKPLPLGDPKLYLERFDRNTTHMIYQDRNHTCVVAYQMLNETWESDVFRRAVAFLPKAREIDKSRLIMLSSGRFDNDFSIGCVANPYVNEWTKVWGADKQVEMPGIRCIGPSVLGSGDVHYYPLVPHTEESYDCFAALGRGSRPVFLSEYGIGTQFNVIHEARMFEQNGCDPRLLDYGWVKKQADDLNRDFKRFGFDRVFPFAETMLNESQRLGARQRTLGFNLIRANPQICGFSLTGLLDHGMCGEGLWSYWRRWKPEMFDAISDGFSSLRFCMTTYPTNAYANRPLHLKVSLATEDALRPGTYSSSYKIVGDSGVVWTKDVDIVIPESMPLAVPVIDEYITLDVPTGAYTLYANLNEGGSPTGEKLTFYVTDERETKNVSAHVLTWGVKDDVKEFLKAHGTETEEFAGQTDSAIIVGYPMDFGDDAKWQAVLNAAEAGQTVIYMSSLMFRDHIELNDKLRLAGFKCYYNQDHLYHKEVVPMPHEIFDGVKPGMFDMDYVGTIFPNDVLEAEGEVRTMCSSFVTGSIWVEGAYKSFYSVMEYDLGKGRVIVSTPFILENIGKNPIADRLLMNYIKYICG